jgi:hypothetical protein
MLPVGSGSSSRENVGPPLDVLQVPCSWPWQKDQSPPALQVGSRKPTRGGAGPLSSAMHLGPSLKWLAIAWQVHMHTSEVSTTWLLDKRPGTKIDITDHATTHNKARDPTANHSIRHTEMESGYLEGYTQAAAALPTPHAHTHASAQVPDCSVLHRDEIKPAREATRDKPVPPRAQNNKTQTRRRFPGS